MAVYFCKVDCDFLKCVNNQNGECIALTACLASKDKACPFYKTREQAAEELEYCIKRKTERLRSKKLKVSKRIVGRHAAGQD